MTLDLRLETVGMLLSTQTKHHYKIKWLYVSSPTGASPLSVAQVDAQILRCLVCDLQNKWRRLNVSPEVSVHAAQKVETLSMEPRCEATARVCVYFPSADSRPLQPEEPIHHL